MSKTHMTDDDKILRVQELIEGFFKGNKQKALLWLKARNPMLGMVSPLWMIKVGRVDKLLQFIENCLDENKRHFP